MNKVNWTKELLLWSCAVLCVFFGRIAIVVGVRWIAEEMYQGALPMHFLDRIVMGLEIHSMEQWLEYIMPVSEWLSFGFALCLFVPIIGRYSMVKFTASSTTVFVTVVILFAGSMAYYFPRLFNSINLYDGGITLCGGMRFCRGEMPYRDFWTLYSPGQFMIVGGLFSLFNESIWALRVYGLLVSAGVPVIAFLIVRRCASFFTACACYFAILACHYGGSTFVLFAMCTLFVFTEAIFLERPSLAVMAGLIAGLATLFRHDMGSILIMGVCIALLSILLHEKSTNGHPRVQDIRMLKLFLVSGVILTCVVYGWFVVVAGFGNMFEQLVRFPLCDFAAYRRLPYPSLISIIGCWPISLDSILSDVSRKGRFYIFPLCLTVGFFSSLRLLFCNRSLMFRDKLLILWSFVGVLLMPYALTRADYAHLYPMGYVAIVVVYILLGRMRKSRISLVLWMLCTSYFLLPFKWHSLAKPDVHAPLISENLQQVIRLVSEKYVEGSVYVGVRSHDKMTANDNAIYYLLGGRFGTKYHELHPGVVTTKPVQEQIVEDMIHNDVRIIILSSGWWEEPNQSSVDHHIRILDNYIQRNYAVVTNIGDYCLLERVTDGIRDGGE